MTTPDDAAIVLIGGGGHAAVVLDALRTMTVRCRGYVDDAGANDDLDLDWLGRTDTLDAFDNPLHAAIGDNQTRAAFFRRFEAQRWRTIEHVSAISSPSATVAPGCFLAPRSVVNPRATLGPGVMINTASIVEHDCRIGACAHLAPGVVLGGNVSVGDRALIGLGARILPGVNIGPDAIVGAGAVVIEDVPAHCMAAGVPAMVREPQLDSRSPTSETIRDA